MFIDCLIQLFERYKEYNSYVIWFLNFSELFPAFNWAKEIGNLLSIWSGVFLVLILSDFFFV